MPTATLSAMTDADFNTIHKRVKAAVERWLTCCGLRWWQRITFHYCRTVETFSKTSGADLDNGERETGGRTRVSWRYKQADVYFNMPIMEGLDEEEIDYVVRHEIAHILVNEMREWAHAGVSDVSIDHEERVVTELAQVLAWVRAAGRDEVHRKKPSGRNSKKRRLRK